MYFARMNLKLSAYDVGDMELKQFYKGEATEGWNLETPLGSNLETDGMAEEGSEDQCKQVVNSLTPRHL